MQTIRGRLTAWYSAALALTLAAFAAVLYLDRRNASYQDLDQRMRSEASLTAGILAESYRARGVLVRPDSAARPVLIPDVAALLEAVPDILIVTARDGSLLFASSDARALTFQQVEQLRRVAAVPGSGATPGSVHIEPDGPTIHYAVRSLTDAGPQFGAILAAANVRTAELGPDQLLATFALVLPFGVAVALLMGSWISRRALGPVDQIITEVREITDGRSLHRRLAEPLVKDELGRLAETLNQMMTRLERSFTAPRRFTADPSHAPTTPLTVLHAGGRQRAPAARPRQRETHPQRRRHRDRHRARRPAAHLRPLLARRLGTHPHRCAAGGGPGARHLQMDRGSARRTDRRREPSGTRHHVHRHPAVGASPPGRQLLTRSSSSLHVRSTAPKAGCASVLETAYWRISMRDLLIESGARATAHRPWVPSGL